MSETRKKEIQSQVRTIVQKAVVHGTVDDATSLVSSGQLDSLNVVSLILELEQVFRISITDEDRVPENFETPADIAKLCALRLGLV